jgi:hypothetical protein
VFINKEIQMEAAQNAAPQRPVANCDQEAWVQDRILTAMKMAISLHKERRVGADLHALDYGLRGIAEGTAIEVIRTLGMEPEGVNLRLDKPKGTLGNIAKLGAA